MAVALARWILGALLLWAGAAKVAQPEALASAIAGFRLLPAPVVAPLAVILPYFELLLGLYLVAGLFTRLAGWVATLQFVIYAGAIASAVLRGIPANCGCFGPGDAAVADWPHVAFDLALAGIALFIALRAPGAFALDRRLGPR
jgi:putative oxidoreductase